MAVPINLNVAPGRAADNFMFRDAFMSIVGTVPDPNVQDIVGGGPGAQIVENILGSLDTLVGSVSRFTGNQQTVYDNGVPRAVPAAGTNAMEQRVLRAWTQVLGRSPGRGADSFLQSLNGAFPELPGGGVATLPARSAVTLTGPDANGGLDSTPGSVGGGLSARQAALYRQTSIVAADAQRVLNGLKPFIPDADPEQVNAIRSLTANLIGSLVQEFGRIDEPREPRVENYLQALNGAVLKFGTVAGYDPQFQQFVVLPADEGQLAAYRLLRNYVDTINNAWATYQQGDPANPSELSLRVDRAAVLIGTINEANEDFRLALLSVGLGEAEQRSFSARFNQLNPAPQPQSLLQDITPIDLTGWIQDFHLQSLSMLSESGRYGLEVTTDQADAIFWVMAPVVDYVQTQPQVGVRPVLLQALQNERVLWAMNNLLNQLDGLADLHPQLALN